MSKTKKLCALVFCLSVLVLVITSFFDNFFTESQKANVHDSLSEFILDLSVGSSQNPVPSGLYGENTAAYFSKAKYYQKNPGTYSVQNGYVEDKELKKIVDPLDFKVYRFPSGDDARYYHYFKENSNQIAKAYGFRKSDIENDINTHGQNDVISTYGSYEKYLQYEKSLPEGHNFIQDIAQMAKNDNARIMYIANVKYGSIDETIAALSYLRNQGVLIAGVELGEESYSLHQGFEENPMLYISKSRLFAQSIKSAFPDVKIGISMAPHRLPSTAAYAKNNSWNLQMANEINQNPHLYDAYIYHNYPQLMCDSFGSLQVIYDCALSKMSAFFKNEYGTGIQVGTYGMLSYPTFSESLNYFKNIIPNKKIWITEWSLSHYAGNVYKGSGYYGNTLLNAIFNATFRHELIKWNNANSGKIEYAIHHNITGSNAFALFSQKNNSELYTDQTSSFWTRRSLYYETLLSKKMFSRNLKQMNIENQSNDKVKLYPYFDSNSNYVYVYFVNLSGQRFSFGNIKYDNIVLNNSSNVLVSYVGGDSLDDSFGVAGGEHSFEGDPMIFKSQSSKSAISDAVFPRYSYGYIAVPLSPQTQNLPPVISVSFPVSGVTVSSQQITLLGSINDSDGSSSQISVKHLVNGVEKKSITNAFQNGNWSLGVFTLALGENNFEISASDTLDLQVTQYLNVFFVPNQNDSVKPEINLVSPIANSLTLTQGSPLIIEVKASDNVGIKNVDFYVGNKKVCTINQEPYVCDTVVPNISQGGVSMFTNYRVYSYDFAKNSSYKTQNFSVVK